MVEPELAVAGEGAGGGELRPEAQRITSRLEFRPDQAGTVLYELEDASFWLGVDCGIPPEAYVPLCRGRCSVEMEPGEHALVIRRDGDRGVMVQAALSGTSRLATVTEDRTLSRRVGAGFLVLAASASAGLIASFAGDLSEGESLGSGIASGVMALTSTLVGIVLMAQRDSVRAVLTEGLRAPR